MSNILSPQFKYTPAAATDIRKTFARIRRELKEREEEKAKPAAKVSQLNRRKQG